MKEEKVIRVRGARQHNLKNIDVDIPRGKMVVVTGLSGSGKSSLAFDTIYAEGQRRYVESLSSYARQFLGQMQKPDVDAIEGLSPAIAIDQKSTSHNPRSTVGTVTEIYDYLRLLYARAGTVHCPSCQKVISAQSVDQMVDQILAHEEGTRLHIKAPVVRGRKGSFSKQIEGYRQEGFQRIEINGTLHELDALEDDFQLDKRKKHMISVVVDRLLIKPAVRQRLADSVETALRLADGLCEVLYQRKTAEGFEEESQIFSQNFSCPDCQISVGEIEPRSFSFNNPFGACPACTGLGHLTRIDPELVVFDPTLSLNEGAIQANGWKFADLKSWARSFIEALQARYGLRLDLPWKDLSEAERHLVLFGNDGERIPVDTSNSRYHKRKNYKAQWIGVVPSLSKRYEESSSMAMKRYYQQYLSVKPCAVCQGDRLKAEVLSVRVAGLNIAELCALPMTQCREVLRGFQGDAWQKKVAAPILNELEQRLSFLIDVGLTYLNLARPSSSLSGGEAQRIRLATQIGSGLMGVIYILDEPSIGLHQRDNHLLLKTLKNLRDLGNTVLLVEHDEDTIRAADHVIDIGPAAGEHGGQLVVAGPPERIAKHASSITGAYLSGKEGVAIPPSRRPKDKGWLELQGCSMNNLQALDLAIPLGVFNCVTGVSGSGKSSLVNETLLPILAHVLNRARKAQVPGRIVGGLQALDKVIAIDQSPIGRTPRSNPATYTDVFTLIRQLFSQSRQAKLRGYKPGRFSFNVTGGRCEHCKGDGVKRIEMHFLPDLFVQCENCKGKRYNRETLEVYYRDKNIAEVLEMTVDEAALFFENVPRIAKKLQTLQDVGLGYIRLGQPSTQLSGGEAQRVKLATELSKTQTGRTFYILDEPTTGLHAADVHRLIDILQRLTENGNTVLVIEHNLDVIKVCDHLIDLGPEGGDGGGRIVASGTPEEVAMCKASYTGQFLKALLR